MTGASNEADAPRQEVVTAAALGGDRMAPVAGVTTTAPRGDKMGPAAEAGVTTTAHRGDRTGHQGVTSVSPEPSLTIKQPSEGAALSKRDLEQANAQVSAMIALSTHPTYVNWDKIPEVYLKYADLFHELTGPEPTARVLSDWLAEFGAWMSEGIDPEHVRQAYLRIGGRWDILRPGSLTNSAAAVKAEGSKKASSAATDPDFERRAAACTQRSVYEGRHRAADWCKERGIPYEDPDTMRPLISDIPALLSRGADDWPRRAGPVSEAVMRSIDEVRKRLSVRKD